MQFRLAALGAIMLLYARAEARLDRLSIPKTIKAGENFVTRYDFVSTKPADTTFGAIVLKFAPASSALRSSLETNFIGMTLFVPSA